MNLNPLTWFTRNKFATEPSISRAQIRTDAHALGPYAHLSQMFKARQVNPLLLEALREAIAPIDGGIGRLVTLDGIVEVEGDNDRLVAEISDWMDAVPVGDYERGFQAFADGLGNETYEQGCAIGEWVTDDRGRDVIGLRVADSKGLYFRTSNDQPEVWYAPPQLPASTRGDGTHQVEAVLRTNFAAMATTQLQAAGLVQLDTDQLVYFGHRNEAGNPYGVSIMRSLEFVSQILLQIQNATGQVWSRYGDPPLSLTYKTKGRAVTADQLLARRNAMAADLAAVMEGKRKGNSLDFVQAIGADDEIVISVIGAQDKIIEIETPARHMLEQIVAKFGLPAWMLGFQWSTSEHLANQQSEIVLQESRTRWARRKPYLTQVVATMLRLRGRTWRRGDWQLVQRLPNLQDMLKLAQADFLRAQTVMMQEGRLGTVPGQGDDAAKMPWADHVRPMPVQIKTRKDASDDGEPFAEPDETLPRLERQASDGLIDLWRRAEAKTLAALGLPSVRKAPGELFTFRAQWLADLRAIETELIATAGSSDGPLLAAMYRAWLRGVENAAADLDLQAAFDAMPAELRTEIDQRGFDLVRNAAVRAMRDDIASSLAAGAYDGLNSTEVARRLSQRFGMHDYDWLRLARSELTRAQVEGKEAMYAEADVAEYDYITMGDERVSTVCREHQRNNPHPVGAGPLPMRDSHPNCRCTTKPRAAP